MRTDRMWLGMSDDERAEVNLSTDDEIDGLQQAAVQVLWQIVHLARNREVTLKPHTFKANTINEVFKTAIATATFQGLTIANMEVGDERSEAGSGTVQQVSGELAG